MANSAHTETPAGSSGFAKRLLGALGAPPMAGVVLFAALGLLTTHVKSFRGDEVVARYFAWTMGTLVAVALAHIVVGLTLGWLAHALMRAWARALGRSPTRAVRWLAVTLLVGAFWAWRLAVTMVTAPHALAPWFYSRGGLRRAIEVAVTEHTTPTSLEVAGGALVLALVLGPVAFARGRAALRERMTVARASRTARWSLVAVAVLAAIGLGALALGTRRFPRAPTTASTRPNVLVLAVESLRADRVLSAGAERIAPNIVALAGRSVSFEEARVTVARTYVSLTTYCSGRWPYHHGIRHMFPNRAAREGVGATLPRTLASLGYSTAAVTDDGGPLEAIDLGFQVVRSPRCVQDMRGVIIQTLAQRHLMLMPITTTPSFLAMSPFFQNDWDVLRPDDLAAQVLDTIDRRTPEPFFLFTFFLTPHFPYPPVYPYYKKFTKPDYAGPARYGAELDDIAGYQEADLEQVRALYDGAVAAADHGIGLILAGLEERGIADRTIVVILGDHGENLGECGRGLGHGEHLRGERTLHVPFVLHDPVHAFPPHKVRGIVRDVDLAPTLASLLGVTVPGMDGTDLGPLLRGEKETLDLDGFSETGQVFIDSPALDPDRIPFPLFPDFVTIGEADDAILDPALEDRERLAKDRAVRTGRWKLHYRPTTKGVRWKLYDMEADPDELTEVSAAHPEVFQELKKKLYAWMTADGSTVKGALVFPPTHAAR